MKYLIVGLGNVGMAYELTRHNIGFMAMDQLAEQQGVKFENARLAFTTCFKHKGRSIYLIKPTTYVNNSGKAVRYWIKNLKLPIENILIVIDDIALPFGKLRLKPKGSSAGHNGLNSITENLGTQDYARLKLGIGNNFPKGKQVDYVLGKFDQQALKALPTFIHKACEIILSYATVGIAHTMNCQ